MIHTFTTRKEVENLDKPGTTTTKMLEYIGTDKLDPAIGSSCKIEQEQTYIEGSESTPMTQSPPKLNRDGCSSHRRIKMIPTSDTKQADKCKDSHEISAHHSDHVDSTANMTRIDRHITVSKAPFDSIVPAIALI
jgi:hypothetical protein